MARAATLFGEWEVQEPKPTPPWGDDAEEHFYVLDKNRRPVPATEEERTAWINSGAPTLVARTDLGGGWEVSTSFDGVVPAEEDQEGSAPLFLTLVLMGAVDDDYVAAYPTWDAAEAGHQEVVDRYKKQLEQLGAVR